MQRTYQILLVEDSAPCRFLTMTALASLDVNVTCASTFQEALAHFEKIYFDLILLDIVLPDGDGLTLLNTFQSAGRETPIFLLTSRETLASKVSAFKLGAEDYLVKPINPLELNARVQMRLNKVNAQRTKQGILRFHGLHLDIPMMRASIHTEKGELPIDLTGKEFKILTFLAQNFGKIFSRDDLVKAVWGATSHVSARTIDTHICAIRRKIQPYGSYIQAIPGSGYRFAES